MVNTESLEEAFILSQNSKRSKFNWRLPSKDANQTYILLLQ